jgi:hypothetical protein
MKTIIFLAALLFTISTSAQISLKAIVLGEEYSGRNSLKTTVGDIKGVLTISLLEDKLVYKISFKPYLGLSEYELQNFKSSVENHYDIQLFKKNASQYYIFRSGTYFAIDIEPQEKDKTSWNMVFSITDQDLEKIKNERKEVIISSDF